MLEYLVQGFLLGLAYLAPIGMQNMYVINSGLRMSRKRAYQVALLTFIFDVSLAIACFYGIGILLGLFPFVKGFLLLVGFVALMYMGIMLIASKPSLKDTAVGESLFTIAFACFAVTWFNPQALVDGTMLIGGARAALPASGVDVFIAGMALASFIWFTGLATATSRFKSVLNEKALKVINILCGAFLVIYGLRLGYELLVLLQWHLF